MDDAASRPEVRGPEPGSDRLGRWVAGRSRRREYWLWLVPVLLGGAALDFTDLPPAARIVVAVPLLLAMIRRLHDLGVTGWVAVLINVASNVLAFGLSQFLGTEIGGVLGYLLHLAALTALGVLPGQPRPNGFGPPPGRKGPDLAETFG